MCVRSCLFECVIFIKCTDSFLLRVQCQQGLSGDQSTTQWKIHLGVFFPQSQRDGLMYLSALSQPCAHHRVRLTLSSSRRNRFHVRCCLPAFTPSPSRRIGSSYCRCCLCVGGSVCAVCMRVCVEGGRSTRCTRGRQQHEVGEQLKSLHVNDGKIRAERVWGFHIVSVSSCLAQSASIFTLSALYRVVIVVQKAFQHISPVMNPTFVKPQIFDEWFNFGSK